jgi:glyceraldehyde-3-phosphate dehydrogenase (NAD(P))
MPVKKIIHIIGTGTIGEPLIGLLSDYKDKLGIDQVTFHKNSALKGNYTKVIDLQKRGAHLAVDNDKIEDFRTFGMEPEFETEEAISRASVVIDCTPKGVGHKNKEKYYSLKPLPSLIRDFFSKRSLTNLSNIPFIKKLLFSVE